MLMSVPEIAGYLDRCEISVIESGGKAEFVRPDWMDANEFKGYIAEIMPHIRPVRGRLLDYLSGGGGATWVNTTQPMDWRQERQRIMAGLVRQRDDNAHVGARIGGFDYYTRLTAYLIGTHGEFPRGWTKACVEMPGDDPRTRKWIYLPYSSPPLKGWKSPIGWLEPVGWNKPRGWIPTPKTKRLLRLEWNARWAHDKASQNAMTAE